MVSRYSAYRRGPDPVSPDVIDRILIGVCAAIWLVLIGMSVAATVALVDLGQGFHPMARNPHTTGALYAVIIISALIIAGAIPMLLRARRMAVSEPADRSASASTRGRQPVRPRSTAARTLAGLASTENVKVLGRAGEAVDRIWLRGTIALTGTIGVALIAVAAATYLMAVGDEGASWFCYGVAGLVTATMPVTQWLHVRQLRGVLAAQ